MPITRSLSDGNKLVDWTQEINETDNQYGLLNGLGLFSETPTNQKAIVFDKNVKTTTLLPQTTRGSKSASYGSDDQVDTFSLALPYFKALDTITADDIQGWRAPGTPDSAETLARVYEEKTTNLRLAGDQTKEYMKIQAVKGVTKSPDGKIVADMFSEFGVTQLAVDFDLGNSATNITQKVNQVVRSIKKNYKGAGVIGRPMVLVDPLFFDKFVTHVDVADAYRNYRNDGTQRLRDDLFARDGFTYFEHRGIVWVAYDATFNLPNGTTEDAFAANEGYVILPQARDLYRGYNGPSSKVSMANEPGQEMFMWEYPDSKDESIDLEIEFASLYFMTRPLASVKVFSST